MTRSARRSRDGGIVTPRAFGAAGEHDGDRLGGLPGGVDRSGHGNDDVDLPIDQLCGKIGKKLAVPGRRSVFNDDGSSDDVAELMKAPQEGLAFSSGRVSQRRQDEIPDPRDAPWTLRRGRERQRENPDDEREDLP